MTSPRTETLTQTFEQTHYCVHADDAWHTLSIASPVPSPLRNWLKTHCHAPCAWIITAYNPQATRVSDEDNAHRDAALRAWLDAHAHAYLPARNCAPDDSWPDEPGACLLDMDEGQARALALRFDQAALVAVPIDGQPQLVWVDT